MLRFESEFGKKLPARIMNETLTARRLAVILNSPSVFRSTYPAGVEEIKAGTADRPLFCLWGALLGARVVGFRSLVAKMHTRRAILWVELNNLELGPSSIEGMAGAIVRHMREVQPVGPYAIFGYSFGGNIAVEVARQLIANDQTVELVTVIDSFVRHMLPQGLSKVVMHLRIIANKNLRESYAYIASRIPRRLFLPKSEIERRIAEVVRQRIRTLDVHRPEVYPGRIVLVRAADDSGGIRIADPTNGWSSICKGGVDIIRMACGHSDFLKEPHVTALAGHLDELLNVIDGYPPGSARRR
jgi:thioesterase domain-containing protein